MLKLARANVREWEQGRRTCPYCDKPMVLPRRHPGSSSTDPRRMSRDHILPREYGVALPQGVDNTRWCCQECNSHRGSCGHCVGALACVHTVAWETCEPVSKVLDDWGMEAMKYFGLMRPPTSSVPWARRPSRKVAHDPV